MGGQSYLTRLALGRSACEPLEKERGTDQSKNTQQQPAKRNDLPEGHRRTEERELPEQTRALHVQQFDDRGHPQNLTSQELSRQSRRAQNDVLATVGVVVGPDQRYQVLTKLPIAASDGANFEGLVDETKNETALGELTKLVQLLVSCCAQDRATYLRNRLQVFPFYSGVPFLEILKIEWARSHPLILLFGGTPGDNLEILLALLPISEFGLRLYNDRIIQRIAQIESPSLRHLLRFLAAIIKIWQGTLHRLFARLSTECNNSTRICFLSISATIKFHAILQGLGILPPVFPSLMTFVPFTTTSLIRPLRWPHDLRVSAGLRLLASVASSPIVLYYFSETAFGAVLSKAIVYFRLVLPKPDNPDDVSIAVALKRKEDAAQVSGLDFVIQKEAYELAREARTVRELAEQDWAHVSNQLTYSALWFRSKITRGSIPSVPLPQSHDQAENDQPYVRVRPPRPAQEPPLHERADEPATAPEEGRPNPSDPGPDIQGVDYEGITFVQQVFRQIHDSPEQLARADVVYDITEVYRKLHDDSRPMHRVTHLTACTAETMAFYLSTMFAYVILLPIETLFLRSVALAYLDTAGGTSKSSSWLRNEIYPKGSWFGMGSGGGGGGAMDYARRITLSLGLEAALGFGMWQLGAGLTWSLGTRVYRWGRL